MDNLKQSLNKPWKIGLLIAVIAFGSFLRFYGLSNQSLWYDEIVTWSISSKAGLGEVISEVAAENRPPAHQILIYFTIKLLGDSETALRLPSALFGAISLLLIFLLTIKIYTYREAIIATALTSVFWCTIYYSQEARDYSLIVMLSTIAAYYWFKINQTIASNNKISLSDNIVYTIVMTLLAYTHYFGILLIFLMFCGTLFVIFKYKRSTLVLLLPYLIALMLYLPWLNTILQHVGKLSSFWIESPTLSSIYGVFYHFYASEIYIVYLMLALLLFVIVKTVIGFVKKQAHESKISFANPDLIMILWLLLPIIIIFIQSNITRSLFLDRYFLISLPAAYILIARAFAELPIPKLVRYISAAVVIVFISFNMIIMADYYNTPVKKTQIREATEFLIANYAHSRDAMIIGYSLKVELINDLFNYYFIKKNSPLRLEAFSWSETSLKELDSIIKNRDPEHIWIIYTEKNPNKRMMNYMERDYKYIQGKSLHRAGAILYRKKVLPIKTSLQ